MKLVLSLLLLGTTACGSMTYRRDAAAIDPIKKVALVAFTEQEPTGVNLGIDSGLPKSAPHVDKMYFGLAKSIGENMKWEVTDLKAMRLNSGYVAAFDQTMKGWQNKISPGEGISVHNVEGVMDADCPRILDTAGRDKLMQQLGVDALIEARVNVGLSGFTVMGIGTRYPQTNVTLMVYTKGRSDAAWMETIEGEKAGQSVGKTGFIDKTLLSELGLKSAQSAFAKVGMTR